MFENCLDAMQEKDISMHLLEFSTNLTTLNLCYRTVSSLRSMRSGLLYMKHCAKIEKITVSNLIFGLVSDCGLGRPILVLIRPD